MNGSTPGLQLIENLAPFVSLLREQERQAGEEAATNKAWHLGTKEFRYRKTLAGDMPEGEEFWEARHSAGKGAKGRTGRTVQACARRVIYHW